MHRHGGSSLEDPWQYECESLSARTQGLVSSRRPDATDLLPSTGALNQRGLDSLALRRVPETRCGQRACPLPVRKTATSDLRVEGTQPIPQLAGWIPPNEPVQLLTLD